MTREQLVSMLSALVALPGASGHEQGVAAWIAPAVRPYADQVGLDGFGNLVALRRADRPGAARLAAVAHMDSVGLVVRHVEESGFLRFETLGGLDRRMLLGREVIVGTRGGPLPGVAGIRPYHLHRGREREAPEIEAMYIDVGAGSAAEAGAMGVRAGDPVTLAGALRRLGPHRVTGPSLDDRAGCALLVALLQAVAGAPLAVDLCAVFTVQEEVGLRGARFLAHRADVDLVLALDTAAAEDTPGEKAGGLRLGGGPGIKRVDSGLIVHPSVWRHLERLAEAAGVPWQPEVRQTGRTDGSELQLAAPAGGISIPCRYTHAPVETVDLRDMEGALALLTRAVQTPLW